MNKRNMALGHRETEFKKKLVGIVEVRTGEKVAELTLIEEGKKFANGKTSLRVDLKDLPKRPALQPNQKTPKQYRVRMNQDGDAVESLGPVRGMFRLRLVDLGKRPSEDGDPAPQVKTWNQGTPKENSQLEFFAVYEFVDGPFKGVQTPGYNLRYCFEENPNDEGWTQFSGNPENPKATRIRQTVEWGQTHGNIWSEPIPWNSDDVDGIDNKVIELYGELGNNGQFANILPTILERALEADEEVNGVFDKGYIQNIQPVEDYESVDPDAEAVDDLLDGDDEEEEEVKPVKVASKAPAKKTKVVAKKSVRRKADEEDDL